MADTKYTANDIELLSELEGVRKRPGMYIGSTNLNGLHHLVWEVIDNSVDEAVNGYGKKITVTLMRDGSLMVEDEGRGVPVDIHKESGIPAVQLIYTTLHSGGKFNSKNYKTSAGLHGVDLRLLFFHLRLQLLHLLQLFLHVSAAAGLRLSATNSRKGDWSTVSVRKQA